MLDNSKNVVVSGSLTVVQGNSHTYESHHAGYPTNSRAGISEALKILHQNTAAGAMHNSKERYDAPKCHPDTRKAVLNDITSWILDHSKETLILWLSAPAGSGKSAILQQISENFHKSGGLSASFFFSRSVANRNADTYLIATLASQIATSIPSTRPFMKEVIERDPSIFQRVLSEQVNHLVVCPLVYASLHPENRPSWPTLLVIDGLDECNGGERQADILHILGAALVQLKCSLPTLYLLIASRPEPAITDVFDDDLSEITHHLVLDETYHPDRDIALFLRSSFTDIYRRRHHRFPSMVSLPQPWPPEDIISFLVEKSSGQFIFAATVIRFIDVDRKIPTAQLQLILDICESVDSSRFAVNPFALLDELYSHVLNSSEEMPQAIYILGATLFLHPDQSPTRDFLLLLLRIKPEAVPIIFWDLHSIIRIPTSGKDTFHFYHASLRDFLMNRHRSGDLCIDESKVHSVLLELCIQTLSDCHSGIAQNGAAIALHYSRKYWITHYNRGDILNPGFLDQVLEKYNPDTWMPLYKTAIFRTWWKDFTESRARFHGRCDQKKCSALCFRYTSILDRYLVNQFQRHEDPAGTAALMWLTLLAPMNPVMHNPFLTLDIGWPQETLTETSDTFQFLLFLMLFLSDGGRSHNLFVGSAISTTAHFAHVCAQRAFRGIVALDRPFGSENWKMLVYLDDILDLLLQEDTPSESSRVLMDEAIIQYIQMRIADLADLVKFVEVTGSGEGSFKNLVMRWRDTRGRSTLSIDLTTARSGGQSLQDEVGTSRTGVKRGPLQPCCGQPDPLSRKGRKRRKIIAIDHTDLGHEEAVEHVPTRPEGENDVNDGRDVHHAILWLD